MLPVRRCTSTAASISLDGSTTIFRIALSDQDAYTALLVETSSVLFLPRHQVLLKKECRMRKQRVWTLVVVVICVLATTALAQTTLEKVKARGKLVCGVNTGLAGFSTIGSDGKWHGFDVDYCRALAAAIFNDPNQVEFRPLTAQARFTALQSGEIDVLSRNTTWTLSRDTSLGLNFGPTLFYDGQGIMVPAELQFKLGGSGAQLVKRPQRSIRDLDGAAICVQSGTTTELNLADFFRRHKAKFTPVVFETTEQTFAAYDSGRCDAVTSDISQLLAQKTTLKKPNDHGVLPVVMSKEPLGPVVRHGDDQWFDIIKWVAFGLIQAEEFALASDNVGNFANTRAPDLRRFLGLEGNFGSMLGLSNDFMMRVVRQVGNYGEIFQRHLQPLNLARGANALWIEGGLLYTPPFR
jgi:general L-amino acid transport system substrate-binding protein